MQIDIGINGAKRTSFNDDNIRNLVVRMQRDHPGCTLESLRELARDEILSPGNTGYVITCVDYAVANAVKSVVQPRRARRDYGVAAARARTATSKRIVEQAHIVLLDMTMPNGLKLRACTGTYCADVGAVWLRKLGDQAGSRLVGDVYTEKQLKKIYEA